MSNAKDRDSLHYEASEVAGAETWLTADLVVYIADMADELKEIADRGGLQTLSGILGLAATEARRQVPRLGKK